MMVGTGAAALADAIALTRHAAELGFAGALVLPPFYYKGVPDDGLFAFSTALVEATADRPVPIYLYHFPANSGMPWPIALIRRLRDAFASRIVGLKDSSGDMAYAREAAALDPSFAVFPSTEAVLLEARAGAFAGCISATANLNADLCARAWRNGDQAALEAGGHDPQAVRRQAARLRRQGAAGPHPWRPAVGAGDAAAGGIFGRGPCRGGGRLRRRAGQARRLISLRACIDASASPYYKHAAGGELARRRFLSMITVTTPDGMMVPRRHRI